MHAASNSSSDDVGHNDTALAALDGWSRAVVLTAYSLASLLSLAGNSLVFAVIARAPHSMNELSAYVVNLAVADLLMAMFCIPFTASQIIEQRWLFSPLLCPFSMFMQHLSVFASIYTLLAIGIDRRLAVFRPLEATARPKSSRALVLSLIWAGGGLYASVNLYSGRVRPGEDICGEAWPEPVDVWEKTFTLFMALVTYVLPCICLFVCYFAICRFLETHMLPGNSDAARDQRLIASRRKVVRMLAVQFAMFAICWLPLHVFFVLTQFSGDAAEWAPSLFKVYVAALWFAMAHSFVNPVIYSFLNPSFQRALRKIVCCQPRYSAGSVQYTSRTSSRRREDRAQQAGGMATAGQADEAVGRALMT